MEHFITDEEELLLVQAIREQEARTSAEIRVCVTDRVVFRPKRYAWRVFERNGMRNTANRNAALIVMMPRVKQIVIIGDEGLDAVVPVEYWDQAVAAMVKGMHEHGPLASLREGLRGLGDVLSKHWPRGEGDQNELPDELLRD
jgi:uncharacterized membrane protein